MPRYVVTFWPRTPRTVAVVADDADDAIEEALPMLQLALTGEGGSWEVREVEDADVRL
jgi:hypothetical protein